MYLLLSSISDAKNLQSDLEQLVVWWLENGLSINKSKCVHISFHRHSSAINFKFYINNEEIIQKNNVRDLGIIFSNDLNFNAHIDSLYNKALRVLGFMKRNCAEFKEIKCFTTLYHALVRSILELGSVICNSSQSGQIEKLDKLQRRFIHIFGYKMGFLNMSPSDIANRIGLKLLATHRKYNDIVFMYKLLNGMIDCSEFLSLIGFKVPTFNTRNILSFHIPPTTRNYVINSPISRLPKSCNEVNN
jgi:phage-related holin